MFCLNISNLYIDTKLKNFSHQLFSLPPYLPISLSLISNNSKEKPFHVSIVLASSPGITIEKSTQVVSKTYPNYKIIVLNDDFNTFEHVASCLMKYIPAMTSEVAWELTNQIHYQGQAVVWIGPQEQAELYHQQLKREGLTMAPLEAA